MLKNTITKTLYIKRWMLLSWCLGIVALVVFTMVFYPTMSKTLGQSLKDVPDSLKSFVGDSATYSTIAGYADLQVFAQLVTMTLIFGIILFTGLIAGEEADGTLQSLLVQPLKRSRIYFEKLIAAITMLGISCLSISFGVAVGLMIINEGLNAGRLLAATFATLLVSLVFSSIGFAIGAITGKRGLAGGLAGALAFTSLLISTLAVSISSLRTVDKLSPFHYFNKPGILQYGPHWDDMVVLAGISIVILVIGAIVFIKRDVYQP